MKQPKSRAYGITLIELMIVVAIISVLAGIAIPAYNGYIKESRLSASRANIEPLRLAMEDYWLDNGSYTAFDGRQWDPSGTQDLNTDPTDWHPDGDENQFIYNVTATTNTYTISVQHISLPASDAQTFSK